MHYHVIQGALTWVLEKVPKPMVEIRAADSVKKIRDVLKDPDMIFFEGCLRVCFFFVVFGTVSGQYKPGSATL